LIYNPFQRMIPHKPLWFAVCDTMVVFFTLQTIQKAQCAVG